MHTRGDAVALVERLRAAGRTIVFTNGVFDLLHVGHLRYLQHARGLGDALIVGLNSDRSVRHIKGPDRPLTAEAERAEILEALACVDAVVVFDEETPLKLIRALRPGVLTKGADYKSKRDVVGWDAVQKWGGRVELVELIEGRSTTKLVSKARS